MDDARGVVMTPVMTLHDVFVTSAHCPEILAMLTSKGVVTLFKYSQSASATHHSTSSEVRCGYKFVGLFFNYQSSVVCVLSVRVLCHISNCIHHERYHVSQRQERYMYSRIL
jgi:hypothetical protein